MFCFFFLGIQRRVYFQGKETKYNAPNQSRQGQRTETTQTSKRTGHHNLTNPSGPIVNPPDRQIVPRTTSRPLPLGIKPGQGRLSTVRVPADSILHFAPSAMTIITQTLPNHLLNLILVPMSIVKTNVIPDQPDCLQGNTFEQDPKPVNFAKLARGSLG
jgi:hypothetical protein